MAKKLLFVFLGMVLLLVGAAVAIPFLVDVDQYRPRIVELANRNLNGRLELGKLKLSLWGRILIKVDGLELRDAAGKQVVSVSDAYFHLPFASILSGSPELKFRMTEPRVTAIRAADGQINLMGLVKKSEASGAPGQATAPGGAAQAPQAQGHAQGAPPAEAVALPAIVTRARLGIELRDARVLFRDAASDSTTELSRLNLVVSDISLTHPMGIEFWADLDNRVGQLVSVKGPARLTGTVTPAFDGSSFVRMSAALVARLDDLVIAVPGMFEKKAGIPLNLDTEVSVTPEEARISKAVFRFHNLEVNTTGSVSNLSGGAHGAPSPPLVKVMIRSNPFALEPWGELVPMMRQYCVNGTVQLEAGANGPSDALKYNARVTLAEVGATVPMMRGKPSVSGDIDVENEQVKGILKATAPGGDLSVDARIVSFSRPDIKLVATSKGLDLDKMLVLPPIGAPAPAAQKQGGGAGSPQQGAPKSAAAPAAPEEDYDALLAPLRDNAIARQTTASADIRIPVITVYGVPITAVESRLLLTGLVASVDSLKLKAMDGTLSATSQMDLSKPTPTYRMEASVQGFDLRKAVSSQMQLFRNTVYGRMSASIKGSGASLTPSKAKRNLDMKGAVKVEDASFASIDVSKMVVGAVNDTVERLAEKHAVLKGLKGKKVSKNVDTESRYSVISSDFSLSKGVFDAPNFVAKAMPNKGIDLEGRTKVDILAYGIDARWMVIDRYDMSGASEVDAPGVEGVVVKRALLAPGKPFQIPVTVKGTLETPEYSYTEVAEYLGKIVLANYQRAATGKAKSVIVEEVQKKVLKSAPPALKKKAADKLKKFLKL